MCYVIDHDVIENLKWAEETSLVQCGEKDMTKKMLTDKRGKFIKLSVWRILSRK